MDAKRYRTLKMEDTFDQLGKMSGLQQATRIAKHYISLISISEELLLLTQNLTCQSDMETVNHLVEKIKFKHEHDFGIALDWNTDPVEMNLPVNSPQLFCQNLNHI